MKFLKLISLLTGVLLVNSCQRDLDLLVTDNNIIGQIITPAPVQASVNGKVTDENNNVVAGAIVRAGTNITSTNNRGLFSFKNIQLDKYASVVTVEANGYFKGIRSFSAAAGSSNFVRLRLIPKILAGSVDAATGAAVILSNGSSISFTGNSFITQSTGQPYTGTVKVFAAPIDPTSPDISQTVPGSFQATDANNFRVVLKSYGMAAVQLEGQSGELLQLASGKTARLRLTIPPSLVSDAPATIPLWSLNETDGLWKQEGQATKTGNYYEGDVAHFSFWNCDVPFNAIYLELTVNTSAGPLPGTLVKITRVNGGGNAHGVTDSAGFVSGMVFSNEPLLLEVLDNCYQTLHSQNIGPFSQNTNLGAITVAIPPQNILTVTGNAVGCNGLPLINGTAEIYWEGQLFRTPIVNGNFSTTVTSCTASSGAVEIIVIDNDNQQQSLSWTGFPANSVINTGSLTACGNSTLEFINYSINGVNYSYTGTMDSIRHSLSVIGTNNATVSGQDSSSYFNFEWENAGIGPASAQHVYSVYSTHMMQGDSSAMVNYITVAITEYGSVGQFISGNFSGILGVWGNYNITCSFRVRRQF